MVLLISVVLTIELILTVEFFTTRSSIIIEAKSETNVEKSNQEFS